MRHLKLNVPRFFIVLMLWVMALPSFALPDDQKKPAQIQADHVEYNRTQGIMNYQGHVVIHQGTTAILADRLITYNDQDNKITKAIAFGTPASYQTLQSPNKPPLHAEAQKIIYDPVHKQVTLIGQAKVTQGKNSITSPKIFYDMQQQSAQTYSSPEQRTNIIFHPESNPK